MPAKNRTVVRDLVLIKVLSNPDTPRIDPLLKSKVVVA